MAKQKGPVKLSGTIGDISFYESNNKFLAREKSGPTRNEVLTKKRYERTRENGAEFGRCSTAGKLLRTSLGFTKGKMPDTTLYNRLNQRLVRVMHTDTQSLRGERRVQLGEFSILEGFEFLAEARLADTFFGRYEVSADRATGTVTLTLPPFIPSACIVVPEHATWVKLVATALAPDFAHNTVQKAICSTEPLSLNSGPTNPLTLTCSFKKTTTLPLLLVLGLEFMEEHEGFCYPLREKEFNSRAVVWTLNTN